MNKTIKYQAHLKPIDFSQLPFPQNFTTPQYIQTPAVHRGIYFDWLTSSTQSQNDQENAYPGPKFSRQDLEGLASRDISPYFGEWFKSLDQHAKLIRMPTPPLLLTDEILGIDGIPGSMGKGSIWTRTTVPADAWYLDQGRMPAGIMIEAGQSDLLLASWLGFDLYNQGKRVYRLLGCEASYHGELPKVGDVLNYVIHIDGHAKQGDVIIFFFRYDCTINGELRLRVRHGQAGFFTEEELANTGGVLWDAESATLPADAPLDAPAVTCQYNSFSKIQLQQFAEGNTFSCFGQGFEYTECHTRTPRIASKQMLLLDEITHFDPNGGPWQRGYMRAVQHIHADDWFFEGHFKNDPCMPGTLILEGVLQTMVCYLTALGYTTDKDGWRFEPVSDEIYKMRCRGQVIPTSKQVVYEIFVYSVIAQPHPTVYAEILCTADGIKSFHTRCGVKLIPDFPLYTKEELYINYREPKPVAVVNGFAFDYRSLLACALGKPSEGFGPAYKKFDTERRVTRLPAPPYHFMSRVTYLNGEQNNLQAGANLICEYDVPKDAWYFTSNAKKVMPFCVLLEVGLQPCGWLVSYLGFPLTSEIDLKFRNLEGNATIYADVLPNTGTLQVEVTNCSVSTSAGMILVAFNVKVFTAEKLFFTAWTRFGYFPYDAFEKQAGLPITTDEEKIFHATNNIDLDILNLPRNHFDEILLLPAQNLLMIDRVTGLWPKQGKNGLGVIRGEKAVKTSDWFFKAHFFQDPVQPGSLGIEAIYHLLQIYILQQGMHRSFMRAHLSPCIASHEFSWKYRGQVVPHNENVTILLEIIDIQQTSSSMLIQADASLWVDGKKIYAVNKLGVTLTEEIPLSIQQQQTFVLDPLKETWLLDHCPNYITPTLPLMNMIDMMAQAASALYPDKTLIGIKDMRTFNWLISQENTHVLVETKIVDECNIEVSLLVEKTKIAQSILSFASHYPTTPNLNIDPLLDGIHDANPYDRLFHGPAFQHMQTVHIGKNGASASLIADINHVPLGCLNPALLDSSIHTIPSEDLSIWSSDIAKSDVSLPAFITHLTCYRATPKTGSVRCETRYKGFYRNNKFIEVEITLFVDDQLWLQYTLINALFPKGKLGSLEPLTRQAFLRDKNHVEGAQLSETDLQGNLYLETNSVQQLDWIPGSMAKLYNVDGDYTEMTKKILMKEYVSAIASIHPADVTLHDDNTATSHTLEDTLFKFAFTQQDNKIMLEAWLQAQ